MLVHLEAWKQVRHLFVKSIDLLPWHYGVARKPLLVERIGIYAVPLRVEDIKRAFQRIVSRHRLCFRIDMRVQEHIEAVMRDITVKITFQSIAPLLFHIFRSLAEKTLGPRIVQCPAEHFHLRAA